MEYPIEIKGRGTPELFSQLYQYTYRWITLFMVAVYGAKALRVWFTDNPLVYRITYTMLCFLVVLLVCQLPKWIAKRSYKAKLNYYGGTMPESISSFGDEISLRDVDSSLTIPYAKIKRAVFLKDCIVLTLADHKSVAIPNREFTRGSLGELKQLLRKKRPDLKIPDSSFAAHI